MSFGCEGKPAAETHQIPSHCNTEFRFRCLQKQHFLPKRSTNHMETYYNDEQTDSIRAFMCDIL
uniref:Uncharacterized protein n=1 Tax=Anopheles funestus TaxID=62324 RepID=A0A182S1R4_ANOFN